MATRQTQTQTQTQTPIMPAAELAAAMAAETPAERLARLKAAKDAATAKGAKGAKGATKTPPVINWPDAVLAAAETLQPVFGLPKTPPVKGLSHEGICRGRRVLAAAPKDRSSLNEAIPEAINTKRHDEMLHLVRAIVHNDFYGERLYVGQSLADGGKVSIVDVLQTLQLGERYSTTKWAQTLWPNDNTCKGNYTNLLYTLARESGRYAIYDCESHTFELVRDFYTS
jgi:hypothetical protein